MLTAANLPRCSKAIGGSLLCPCRIPWTNALVACVACVVGASTLLAHETSARNAQKEWSVDETSLALRVGDQTLWQFNYDSELNKPFFHPLATPLGNVLTCNSPSDHRWHHALWFSWKYINGVNYWENSGKTGRPRGRTEWSDIRTTTHDDFSATIGMSFLYRPSAQDEPVLKEERSIDVSSPAADNVYTIDWNSEFVALQSVLLDRTPPKSPTSAGGYAGLSIRFSADLEEPSAIALEGPAEFNAGDRYRGRSSAMEYGGIIDGNPVGVAILNHPSNIREPTPWYLIAKKPIRYINAAILSDSPLPLEAGERLQLTYRIIVHDVRWGAPRLQAAYREFATEPEPFRNTRDRYNAP